MRSALIDVQSYASSLRSSSVRGLSCRRFDGAGHSALFRGTWQNMICCGGNYESDYVPEYYTSLDYFLSYELRWMSCVCVLRMKVAQSSSARNAAQQRSAWALTDSFGSHLGILPPAHRPHLKPHERAARHDAAASISALSRRRGRLFWCLSKVVRKLLDVWNHRALPFLIQKVLLLMPPLRWASVSQALRMGASIAMPEKTEIKPSIELVGKSESETSIRPEDKVGHFRRVGHPEAFCGLLKHVLNFQFAQPQEHETILVQYTGFPMEIL